MSRTRLCILCAVLTALAAWLVFGVSTVSAQDKPVSFINDVAPILKENCFACHDAKKRSGKYDMTTYEKLMAGGAGGEGIAIYDSNWGAQLDTATGSIEVVLDGQTPSVVVRVDTAHAGAQIPARGYVLVASRNAQASNRTLWRSA